MDRIICFSTKKYINERSLNALQPEQRGIDIIKDHVVRLFCIVREKPINDSKDQFVVFNERSNACTPDHKNFGHFYKVHNETSFKTFDLINEKVGYHKKFIEARFWELYSTESIIL